MVLGVAERTGKRSKQLVTAEILELHVSKAGRKSGVKMERPYFK